MSKKSSPIWIPITVIAMVVGAILLIQPTKKPGVFSKSFSLSPQIGTVAAVGAKLTDSEGQTRTFGSYLTSGRPVLLLPIFYGCTGVCETESISLTKVLTLETALSTRKEVNSVMPGRDFDLVVVSIHPKEGWELARANKAEMIANLSEGWKKMDPAEQAKVSETVNSGIHFTVGKAEEVRKLTDSIGFYYTFDEKANWVNHPAAAAYIASSGKIVAYNTGSNFPTKIVRNNVIEAASGKTQPLGDVFLLGCFKMSAASPRTAAIVNILNLSALFTVAVLSLCIWRWNKSFPSNTLSSGGPQD
ncbi:MAG TPA: hypothetical protein VK171_13925 [Fimbriimonas sp.]|nr:hypothetical protein [Fimbriimonas sp.]